MKQKAVVFNIEDILFDKKRQVHRVNYFTGETESFFKKVQNKISRKEVIYALQELSRKYKIVLISTLSKSLRGTIEDWLCTQQVVYNDLHLKPDYSKQPDNMYKVQVFFDSINRKYDVEYIFRTRKEVMNFLESE